MISNYTHHVPINREVSGKNRLLVSSMSNVILSYAVSKRYVSQTRMSLVWIEIYIDIVPKRVNYLYLETGPFWPQFA